MDVKQEMKLKGKRYVKVFFTDKTSVAFSFEKQGGDDMSTLAANVKKAIDANKLAIEANGDPFIIPLENIKYVQVSPAPEALPTGVIRNATVVG
jgi:hypothetical protein